ncbi:MAG: ABC transporter ATP-binding protein, partial [Synechococcaceae cyanobacterium]
MLAPQPAAVRGSLRDGVRRLWPLMRPHRRRLAAGGACIVVYVLCWPLLAALAGQLIPAIGAGDL